MTKKGLCFNCFPGFLLRVIAVLALVGVLLSPIILLSIISFESIIQTQTPDWISLVLPSGRRAILLKNSITLATLVSVSSLALGTGCAFYVWNLKQLAREKMLPLTTSLVALPTYIYAFAWFSISFWLSKTFIATKSIAIRGWIPTVWVETIAYSTIVFLIVFYGLLSVDPNMIFAGNIFGEDSHVISQILLPLLLPALVVASSIVFLLSLLDYSVPSLFQVNVYSMEIFAEFAATNDVVRSFLLSFPLLLVSILVLLVLIKSIKTLITRETNHRFRTGFNISFPLTLRRFNLFSIAFISSQLISVLLFLILYSKIPFTNWFAIKSALQVLTYSLIISFLVSIIGISIAITTIEAFRENLIRDRVNLLLFISLLPFTIPASVIGIAIVMMKVRYFPTNSLFSEFAPIYASVIRFTPLMMLLFVFQLKRRDNLIYDASKIYLPSLTTRIFRIHLPLLLPSILASMGFVIALAMGELGATLLLIPPGKETLTIRIYSFLHYGASETVAILSLLMIMGVMILCLFSFLPIILQKNN